MIDIPTETLIAAIGLLDSLRDYMSDRADAELFESGYQANEEMRAMCEIDSLLARLNVHKERIAA
jgi:hypothetical protein